MLKFFSYNIILPKYLVIVKKKGSSFIFSALGGWDKEKREKPAEKIAGGFQQAGKKEGGLGEGIFARLLSAPKARQGWEAARPCVSKEAKPAKIVSLIEKEFCARPLKKEIFAGFVRRQAASRWGGFLPVRAEILAQNGFALRSVIATKE